MGRSAAAHLLALLLIACEGGPAALDAGAPRADSAPPADAGIPQDLDGFIEHEMASGGLPGAAVAIATPDGIPLVRGYGYADLESARPVDEHTLFVLASISKTVAGVRAMQLVEAGMLDLDAAAATYLGHPLEHPDHPGVEVSPRMLLTHTSGLEDDFLALGEATYTSDPTMSLEEFTRAYAVPGGALYTPDHWGARPGARRSYCNAGFGVVGRVLEGAGGAPYAEQTRAAIFAPLGMDGAGWFLRDVDAARLATPYAWNGRSYGPLPQRGYAFYPATSLRVSALGLARYARMLLRGGELEGTRILTEASVRELLRVQLPEVDRRQALAFSERRVAGEPYVGHSGSSFGSSTQLLLARDGTHALVLLTNSDAYIRSRILDRNEGRDAIEAILARLREEALAL